VCDRVVNIKFYSIMLIDEKLLPTDEASGQQVVQVTLGQLPPIAETFELQF
jgi:hypothetical protein